MMYAAVVENQYRLLCRKWVHVGKLEINAEIPKI